MDTTSAIVAKYLPKFIAHKKDYREVFKCICFTGEYGIATNTHYLLIFPSKVPAMVQNYYTRNVFTGTFPDAMKVIPSEFESSVKLNRCVASNLIMATKCVNAFCGDEIDCNPMKLNIGDGKILVTAKVQEREMIITIETPCQCSGPDISLSISASSLVFALSCAHELSLAMSMDEISIDFAGNTKPFVITAGEIRIIGTPLRDP